MEQMYVNIMCVIILVVVLSAMYYKGKKEEVKKVTLSLVIKAEKIWGSKTGDIKYASVIGEMYPKLPSIIRLFITEKEIDNMIEDSVLKLKEMLSE